MSKFVIGTFTPSIQLEGVVEEVVVVYERTRSKQGWK